MSRILVLTEGRKTEPSVLGKYLERIKEERRGLADCQLDIVSYNSNIYVLYNKIKEHSIDGVPYADTIDVLRLMQKERPDPELEAVLGRKYPYIYLVFDFEYQDRLFNAVDKTRILQDMLSVFNDETENGLLLINYPMAESYRHWADPHSIYDGYRNLQVSAADAKNYKKFLGQNNFTYDINRYKLGTFETVAKAAISETNWMLENQYSLPSYETFVRHLGGSEILSRQTEEIDRSGRMFVLPCLMFLFVSYFGLNYYRLLQAGPPETRIPESEPPEARSAEARPTSSRPRPPSTL